MYRVWFFLLLLLPMTHALTINEVMYDLPGSDTGREWIEIYDDQNISVNLSEYKLLEAGTNHAINFIQGSEIINQGEFAVVADNAATFLADWPGFSGNLFDSSFTLLNTVETLALKNSSLDVLENITYDSSVGGDGNGNTLCRYPDGFQGLAECGSTPGSANLLPNSVNNTNVTTNFTGTNNACDLALSISLPNTIIVSGSTLNYDLIINDISCVSQQHDYTIVYSIEDLFGNPVSGFPKNTTPTITTCTETTPRQWKVINITGSEAYLIKANITDPGCNETTAGNNNDSSLVIVKGSPQSTASTITISSLNLGADNEIKYGEAGETSLTIYKGQTAQTAVNVYVKDSSGAKLSETTNFNLNTEFTSYSINVPIQMKPNCDGSLPQGTQTLVVDGLGILKTTPITVSGISSSTCQIVTVTQTVSSSSGGGGSSRTVTASQGSTFTIAITDYKTSVAQGEEFETTANLFNNFTVPKNFSVYSYVYLGNEPVSLGYSSKNDQWLGTFDANEKTFEIPPGTSLTVKLRNVVENNTAPGNYNLRVRSRIDTTLKDVTRTIAVVPSQLKEFQVKTSVKIGADRDTENETVEKINVPENRITTFAVSRQTNMPLVLSPLSVLINFLLSLF